MFLGGGFGRRAVPASDFIVEAVHVAKAAGAPVKTSGRARTTSAAATTGRCGTRRSARGSTPRASRSPGSTRSSASRSSRARRSRRDDQGRHRRDVGRRRGGHRLRGPQRRGRPAQPAVAGARPLVALGRPHAHRLRGRELHRRAGARGGQGPVRLPPRAARRQAAAPGRARARRPEGGLGHAAARRAARAASRCTTRSAASCAQVAEVSHPGQRDHACTGSSARSTAAWPSTRETIRAQMEGGIVFGLSAALYGADHAEAGPRAAEQLPRLPGAAHERDAGGGGAHRAQHASRPRASASRARR